MRSAVAPLGEECNSCNAPCIADLYSCTGLPVVVVEVDDGGGNGTDANGTDAGGGGGGGEAVAPPPAAGAVGAQGGACNDFDLDAIDTWYTAYDLTFVRSIKVSAG